ncbi:MAG: hypothetical protein NT062_34325 [Proteobacteria bacterium]|nr:hypothetical protein [Pseudomonadota bacterium]
MRHAVLLGALLVTGGAAHADSLGDLLGPREIALGEALRGGATGSSAIGMNPAGLGLNRELVFEGGYGYRASDSASLVGVSACDSTSPMPGCFFYDYAGSNPDLDGMTMSRRTHVAGMSLSRAFTSRVLIGASIKYFRFDSSMPMEVKTSGVNWDLGMTLRMTDMVNLGLTGYNLFGTESTQFPRAIGGGVMARPAPSLGVSFDMRWRLDGAEQAARYGGGLEYFLTTNNGQSGYPLRGGALHDNSTGATYMSAGIGLANIKWGLDLGARKQVSNGDELTIMASMRFFGPREASPALE